MQDCKEYSPGEVMGKTRPVCKFYINGGFCKHPKHFSCELVQMKSRGGLAIKCKKTNMWELRKDCENCMEENKEGCLV